MSTCPPFISAGTLRTLVQVEVETRTPDGAGGYTVAWATSFSFWAEVQQIGGGEKFAQQQLWANGGAKIRTRWSDVAALAVVDRLIIDGQIYNVRHIADVDHWHAIGEIKAERGVVQ